MFTLWGQAPPVTHLLLVSPPRAFRSAASRGPARARWGDSRWTGSSGSAIGRGPQPSHRRGRCPTPRPSSSSPAGPRFPADATPADEPRSTARVCGGCTLCHRAGVKAGQPAGSTSSRMERVFLCCWTCGGATLLYCCSFSPELCLRALLSPYLLLSIVLFITESHGAGFTSSSPKRELH